jgi:hypothetical protein
MANITRLLFIVLISISSISRADTWVSLGGGSVHLCHTCGYNNFNPGLHTIYETNFNRKLTKRGKKFISKDYYGTTRKRRVILF